MAVGRVGAVDIPAAPAAVVDDMRTLEVKYQPGQSNLRGRSFADGVASAVVDWAGNFATQRSRHLFTSRPHPVRGLYTSRRPLR